MLLVLGFLHITVATVGLVCCILLCFLSPCDGWAAEVVGPAAETTAAAAPQSLLALPLRLLLLSPFIRCCCCCCSAHRLGPNYLQLPVNAPHCAHHNNHHDGFMNFMHRDSEVNYFLAGEGPQRPRGGGGMAGGGTGYGGGWD